MQGFSFPIVDIGTLAWIQIAQTEAIMAISTTASSDGGHGGHPAETTETGRLEQGVSPCAATLQERQSVLPDKVKGNGQTNHLPTIFITMDSVTDKKKDQIKVMIEKMKQEGKPID